MSPYNKLWTKTAFVNVPPLYATENVPVDDKTAYVKIFCIRNDQRWFVLEYDPQTGKAFCLHTQNGETELGYSIINDPGDNWDGEDMQSLNNRARMLPPFERDSSFQPTTLAKIREKYGTACPA